MCGIAGIIGPSCSQEMLMKLLNPIMHRGEVSHQIEILSDSYVLLTTKCDCKRDCFVKYLYRMFSLAIFDTDKNKPLFARDHVWIKHIYYENLRNIIEKGTNNGYKQ